MSPNQWTPKLFLMEDTPPRLEMKNRFGAFAEPHFAEEVPTVSLEDFPSLRAKNCLRVVDSISRVMQRTEMRTEVKAQRKRTTHESQSQTDGKHK